MKLFYHYKYYFKISFFTTFFILKRKLKYKSKLRLYDLKRNSMIYNNRFKNNFDKTKKLDHFMDLLPSLIATAGPYKAIDKYKSYKHILN